MQKSRIFVRIHINIYKYIYVYILFVRCIRKFPIHSHHLSSFFFFPHFLCMNGFSFDILYCKAFYTYGVSHYHFPVKKQKTNCIYICIHSFTYIVYLFILLKTIFSLMQTIR